MIENKKEKSLIFDTGPLITLTMNNLLTLLKPLKEKFGGEFYITQMVEEELIHRPINSKQFKFKALQTMKEMKDGVIKVLDDNKIRKKGLELLELANSCYSANGRNLTIVHHAEMEVLAAAILQDSEAIVVDERTTRYILESPQKLLNRLKRKMRTLIRVNKQNLNKFLQETKNIKVIRSSELVTVAYELGLLNEFLPSLVKSKDILLDALLWGVKLDGCALSVEELDEIKKAENKRKNYI